MSPEPPERGPPDVQELINAAADKWPICPRWNTRKGCKKGRHCKLLHGRPGDRSNTLQDLPWMSVHSVKPDMDDESIAYDNITLRPPLREAIQEYIKSKGLTRNFLLGSWQWTWTNSSGTRDPKNVAKKGQPTSRAFMLLQSISHHSHHLISDYLDRLRPA